MEPSSRVGSNLDGQAGFSSMRRTLSTSPTLTQTRNLIPALGGASISVTPKMAPLRLAFPQLDPKTSPRLHRRQWLLIPWEACIGVKVLLQTCENSSRI